MNLVLIEAIPLLLRALAQNIEGNTNHNILYQSTSLENLLPALQQSLPDLIWLDTAFPEVCDGSLIKSIKGRHPEIKIILYSTSESIPEIRKYFKDGASGYLLKTAAAEEIVLALSALNMNDLYLSNTLNRALASWLTFPSSKKKPGNKLTQREQEVLQLIVEEFTTTEIAKKLYIGQCTVETHRIKLIQKLGVKNTAGLVREAMQRQLCCF